MTTPGAFDLEDADIEEKVIKKLKENDPKVTGLKIRLGVDDHAVKLFKVLKKNNTLSSLHLFGDCLSNKNAKLLAEALRENESLTFLQVSEGQLGPEGIIHIVSALSGAPNLRSLVIGPAKGNWGLMDQAAGQLAQVVAPHDLVRLDFVGYNLSDEAARSLGFMLTLNTSLKALTLSENPIGDDGLLAIARGLKDNHTLKHLLLERIISTPTGFAYIIKALKQYNSTLVRLSLNGNKSIDVKTVAALCDVISNAKALNHLELNDIGLGNEGVGPLFRVLARDCGLRRLLIANNGITNIDALDLMLGNGLQELDLSDNQIGNAGAKHIAKTLRYNRCLVKLSLCSCGITEQGKLDLSKEILFNNIIAKVSLQPNDNGKGLDDAANKILSRNESLNVERLRIRSVGIEKANATAELIQIGGKSHIDMGNLDLKAPEQVEQMLKTVCNDPLLVRHFLVYNNRLTELPLAAVSLCANLTELDISNNRLMTIPPGIARLRALVIIDVRSNQISHLCAELVQLTNLTALNVQNNMLHQVPQKLLANPKLSALRITGNEIPSPLDSLYEQWNAPRVDLSGLQLRTLPPELFFLDKVAELALNDNELTSLPPEIGSLQSLKSLDVRNNKLNSLPWQLAQLTRLQKLAFDGNPLGKMPAEVRRAALPKVLEFCAALKSGSEAVHRSEG